MTIVIEIPALPGGAVRTVLGFAEPVALAIAAACGAGVVAQLAVEAALRLARHVIAE